MTIQEAEALAQEVGGITNVLLHGRHDNTVFTSGELLEFVSLVVARDRIAAAGGPVYEEHDMRFAHDLLIKAKEESDVLPGNVYPAKGGRKSPGTEWWLVVAVSATGAHCIGFNDAGYPVSTASYTKGAMRERPVIGRVDMD